MRTFIYVKLTLDVTMILVLLFVFQAYTTKLQVVSEDISKQPTYNLEELKTQMTEISGYIKEHKEFEAKYRNEAELVFKYMKDREGTNRKQYTTPNP